MRDVPVDGSMLLLPGGPSMGNLDATKTSDGDGDGPHNTGLEQLDAELSHVEAEQLRMATQSPELYICDGWCKMKDDPVRRNEESATVVSLHQ